VTNQSRYRREMGKELVERFAALDVIEKRLHRFASADEDPRGEPPVHNVPSVSRAPVRATLGASDERNDQRDSFTMV
jgi:hypothetical protein